MVTRFKVWNWLEDQEKICKWKKKLPFSNLSWSASFPGWLMDPASGGVRIINMVFVAIIVFVPRSGLGSTTVDQSYLSWERMLRNSPQTFPSNSSKTLFYHNRLKTQYLCIFFLNIFRKMVIFVDIWDSFFMFVSNMVGWDWTHNIYCGHEEIECWGYWVLIEHWCDRRETS